MAVPINGGLPPNFPTPAQKTITNFTFPSDLITDSRQFYTQIQFVKTIPFASEGSYGRPVGGINLPIPKKLNDNQVLVWEEVSLTAMIAQGLLTAGQFAGNGGNFSRRLALLGTAASQAGGAASTVAGMAGVAINPFLWMMFKSPAFKEFTLTWTFAPNNEQESNLLASIIRNFKINSLPSASGAFYEYPDVALIRLFPNDVFTFKFKPCAVQSVQVDYTGGGVPSFFANGAPTIVNLTLFLKEIELWTKENYDQ